MFARNSNAVLVFMLAVNVSNGFFLPSWSLRPNYGQQPQERTFRQSKRHASFGNEATDKWSPYGKEKPKEVQNFSSKRHPWFEHPGSRPPWRKRVFRFEDNRKHMKSHEYYRNREPPEYYGNREPPEYYRNREPPEYYWNREPQEYYTRKLSPHFMLQIPKSHRPYDVPQTGCPEMKNGLDSFACPSSDETGRVKCIGNNLVCDGFIDCPFAEDEDRQACMFYKMTKAHLDVVADAVIRWARGR